MPWQKLSVTTGSIFVRGGSRAGLAHYGGWAGLSCLAIYPGGQDLAVQYYFIVTLYVL